MKYSASTLIIIYLFLLFGYIFTRGFYSFGSFATILFGFLLFAIYYLKPQNLKVLDIIPIKSILPITLIISLILSIIFYGGLYQNKNFLFIISQYLLAISILISTTYLMDFGKLSTTIAKWRFNILLIIAILLEIFMIISSPHPKIDVFDQLKLSSEGLIRGINPYSQIFPQIYNYPQDYFPYLPLTAIVVLPFNIFLGDPRFTLIAANLLVVYILRKILKESSNPLAYEAIPLIYLFHPQMTFMIEQAWIDPIISASFIAFIYSVMNKKRGLISGILLGITISLKQTFILLLPFLYVYKKISRKILLGGVIILITSIIPFLIWDSSNFIKDIVINHVERRYWWHNSLTFNSFYFAQFGKNLPSFLFFLIWGGSFALILRRLKSFPTLILGITLWFLIFYFFNYQAYIHYYSYVSSLMLTSISLAIREESNASYDKK